MSRAATALALVLLAGCSTGYDTERIEQDIKEGLEEYGVPVESVRCPDQVEDETGKAFSCVARAEGGEVGLRVTLTDGLEGFRWKFTTGLVRAAELEDRIEAWLDEQVGGSYWIDCGRSHRIATPGRTFTCVAEADTGHARNLLVTIEDENGNVRWVVQKP